MQLFTNELSIHGQFSDIPSFRTALRRVMAIREIARRFGRQLYCHRNFTDTQVTRALKMQQVVQAFDHDERRALMQWLAQQGPFWEDTRIHGPEDYLSCNDGVVTDSAVGEAAFGCFQGLDQCLVSLVPSSWAFDPLPVVWVSDSGAARSIEVRNYWEPREVESALQPAPMPLSSWLQLEATVVSRCPSLTFSGDAFAQLRGHPFSSAAAQGILVRLDTLHRFRCCVDADGKRTAEGQLLYQNHFTGDGAWFTDSSKSEKDDFREKLTFRHPKVHGERLLCGWHGKVKTTQLRIHFSWPVPADQPLYVVYIGPKLTKR